MKKKLFIVGTGLLLLLSVDHPTQQRSNSVCKVPIAGDAAGPTS